jgi:hypothetical protein
MNEELLPFIGTEALAAGTVTRRTLASRHDMVYRNVYLRKGVDLPAECPLRRCSGPGGLTRNCWVIIRVSRDLVRYRPHVFLARVRDAVRTAGWPHWRRIQLGAGISWLDRVA